MEITGGDLVKFRGEINLNPPRQQSRVCVYDLCQLCLPIDPYIRNIFEQRIYYSCCFLICLGVQMAVPLQLQTSLPIYVFVIQWEAVLVASPRARSNNLQAAGDTWV